MRVFFMIVSSFIVALSITLPRPAAGADTEIRDGAAVALELLAADRAFSTAAGNTDTVNGLAAMFTDDVLVPTGGRFVRTRAEAIEALRSNPFNLQSRAEWTPIRAGVSADGQHGFTFGYMTLTGQDGTRQALKYLAYWVRRPEGWRVAVYKRVPRADGEISLDTLPHVLPARMVAPTTDAARIEADRRSLRDAEQSFSDDAQRIGTGAAFTRYGTEESAIIVGPQPHFIIGAEAIGRNNNANAAAAGVTTGSAVNWNADDVLVASSGDLGVSWGMIRRNVPREGQPNAFPFFTIWRRASPEAPWRYIAE